MSDNNKTTITEKLSAILEMDITLQNTSPVIMGSGEDENFDLEITKYKTGTDEIPYLPGTAYMGVLKHHFFDTYDIESAKSSDIDLLQKLTCLFGNFTSYFPPESDICTTINTNKIKYQSHIIAKDFVATGYTINFRDGIELERTTLTTKENSKFDFELIEPGATFTGKIKIKIRKGIDDEFLKFIVHFIKEAFGTLAFGRNTTAGYGKMCVKACSVKKYSGREWLNKLQGKEKIEEFDITGYQKITKKNITYFKVELDASIANSLLIGGSLDIEDTNEKSDKPYIKYKSNKKELPLPGRAYRQPLLHRMSKILKILKINENVLKELQGFENEGKKNGYRGRLEVEEITFMKNTITEKIHHRTMIDHFTGGGIKGALFDSTPLWHDKENLKLVIKINDYKPEEAALLLHAIKDLAHEDIALGGEKSIGRGRIKGSKISLEWTSTNAETKKSIIKNCELLDDKGNFNNSAENKNLLQELETMNTALQNFKTVQP